jgi:hypothetical protein
MPVAHIHIPLASLSRTGDDENYIQFVCQHPDHSGPAGHHRQTGLRGEVGLGRGRYSHQRHFLSCRQLGSGSPTGASLNPLGSGWTASSEPHDFTNQVGA